jgi:hypothetical protein
MNWYKIIKASIYNGNGYWLSPTGQLIAVERSHAETAVDYAIRNHNKVLKFSQAYDFMYGLGFCRIYFNQDKEINVSCEKWTREIKDFIIKVVKSKEFYEIYISSNKGSEKFDIFKHSKHAIGFIERL